MQVLFFLPTMMLALLQFGSHWTIQEAYAVKFSTKKAVGTFQQLAGEITFDQAAPEQSSFNVWVATESINTGNKTKDKHARGVKWLDAKNHPKITFSSTNFTQTEEGYSVQGQLSIRGITKEVEIPFTFSDQVFSGSFEINRQDYEIKGPFLFGGMVGDQIRVDLNIPVAPK